jgi:hypothetical protein
MKATKNYGDDEAQAADEAGNKEKPRRCSTPVERSRSMAFKPKVP